MKETSFRTWLLFVSPEIPEAAQALADIHESPLSYPGTTFRSDTGYGQPMPSASYTRPTRSLPILAALCSLSLSPTSPDISIVMTFVADLFDVNKQLAFYAAYHTNRINIAIHMVGVPLIVWSLWVFLAPLAPPEFVPQVHYELGRFLTFELNWPAIIASIVTVYYFILEPSGAALYVPQIVFTVLHATNFAQTNPDHLRIAAFVHGSSWLAQFAGHAFAEKRAPALLDNILGAFVLGPFFVHLEALFPLGFKPTLHKNIQRLVGIELVRIRTEEGRKKRAAANAAEARKTE